MRKDDGRDEGAVGEGGTSSANWVVVTVITMGWHVGTSTVRCPWHGLHPFRQLVSPLWDTSSPAEARSE